MIFSKKLVKLNSRICCYESTYTLDNNILFSFCRTITEGQFQHELKQKGKVMKVGGVSLLVELAGKGEPLFLIPGSPGAAHVYLHSFDRLKANNLLVFVDYYGRGKSATATDPNSYSIEKEVDEVEGVRKELGFKSINIL